MSVLEKVALSALVLVLVYGIIIDIRQNRHAKLLNVAGQFLAALVPVGWFTFALFRAKRSGEQLDGMEGLLIYFSSLMALAACVTWALYAWSAHKQKPVEIRVP